MENNPQFEEMRMRARDAIADALWCSYDCSREWEAWSVGTMGQDDFSLVVDDESRILEVTDAAISAILPNIEAAKEKALSALDDADNLDANINAVLHGAHALCNFLESIGFSDVVEKYKKIDKWHA